MKHALMRAASAAQVFAMVARSRWRGRRLLILGYHGVALADEHRWNPPLYMAPDVFRRRLALLRTHRCAVLGLDAALAHLAAGTLPPRAVTLTFDDGFHDFHARALPLLQEFGYPATVYLTTHYAGRDMPVFDVALSYLLWRGRGLRLGAVLDGDDDTPDPRLDTPYELASAARRADAWRAVRDGAGARGWDTAQKDALAARLAGVLGVDYAALRAERLLHLMTPPEVAACAAAGVTFALHTHRHRTPTDRATFVEELATNREALRAMLPEDRWSRAGVQHFCYPSGDYRPEYEGWLAAGIVSATTCVPGLCTARTPALALPRFVDGGHVPAVIFEAAITGTLSLVRQAVGRVARRRLRAGHPPGLLP